MNEDKNQDENEIESMSGDEPVDEDFADDDPVDASSEAFEDETIDDEDDPAGEESAGDSTYVGLYPITHDAMDIDAALAAVSQLDFLTQSGDDHEAIDTGTDGALTDEADYEEIQPFTRNEEVEYSDFSQAEPMRMVRGQLASVIPALVLITLGGWLTFMLTTSNQAPTLPELFPVILIAVGAIFLSQWLSSKRWARGGFFVGLLMVLIGAIQLFLSRVSADLMAQAWTLWLAALGVTLLATGYLTYPRLPRMGLMGLMVIISGGIAYVLFSGLLDPALVTNLSNLWIVALVVLVFLVFAPLIRRRQ